MIQVKICGITRAQDALLAAELGASAVGFIFWRPSPRFIEPRDAGRIVAMLPPMITAVGVFVDQPAEYVQQVTSLVKLGAIQLHGRESRGYCKRLKQRVIKTIPVEKRAVTRAAAWPASVTLLLDVDDPIKMGGTGRTVDWRVAVNIARSRPVILSGGLRPENVGSAIAAVRPYAVDVSSGVERTPGVKDPGRLRAFLAAVWEANVRLGSRA